MAGYTGSGQLIGLYSYSNDQRVCTESNGYVYLNGCKW